MSQDDEISSADKRQRILEIAERLLRESGGVAFSMKALAARANISLKTAYNLFGSKQGVMLELLRADGIRYRRERDSLGVADHTDLLDRAFIVLRAGINHYLQHSEFYEYIFSVEDAVNSEWASPARDVVTGLKQFLRGAIDAGTLRQEIDVDMMAEHFTDSFSGGVTAWAKGKVPSPLLYQRIAYSYAVNLAAIATEGGRERMLELALALQRDPDAGPRAVRPRARRGKVRNAAALG